MWWVLTGGFIQRCHCHWWLLVQMGGGLGAKNSTLHCTFLCARNRSLQQSDTKLFRRFAHHIHREIIRIICRLCWQWHVLCRQTYLTPLFVQYGTGLEDVTYLIYSMYFNSIITNWGRLFVLPEKECPLVGVLSNLFVTSMVRYTYMPWIIRI